MMKRKPKELNYFRCSRRDFIKKTMTGLGTFAIGSLSITLIQGCSSTDSEMYGTFGFVNFQRKGGSIIVNITRPENQALASVGGTLALGGSSFDRKGILLYRESETIFKAYSRACTHQQCTIGPFLDGVSSCPCHGSRFDLTGDNISGPASKPLDQYTTAVDRSFITISPK